jgi:HAD superfamily hydrolase (TIGR01509 family)
MTGSGRLRGVLLDLDGTIADSIDFFYGLACEVLAAANCAPPERAIVLESIAHGIVPHEKLLPADLPDREAFLARLYRDHWPTWIRRYGTEIEPLAGAVAAIGAIGERGLRLGLVTSSSGELPFLDRWGIRAAFDVIVRRDDVSRIKPDPEPLVLALSRLELDSQDVLHVGDTPLDVRAGLAAGLPTIGVLTGAGTEAQLRDAGAAHVLGSIAELPDFLASRFFAKNEECDTGASEPRSTRS